MVRVRGRGNKSPHRDRSKRVFVCRFSLFIPSYFCISESERALITSVRSHFHGKDKAVGGANCCVTATTLQGGKGGKLLAVESLQVFTESLGVDDNLPNPVCSRVSHALEGLRVIKHLQLKVLMRSGSHSSDVPRKPRCLRAYLTQASSIATYFCRFSGENASGSRAVTVT